MIIMGDLNTNLLSGAQNNRTRYVKDFLSIII